MCYVNNNLSNVQNRFYKKTDKTDFDDLTTSGYYYGVLNSNTPDGSTTANWGVDVQAFDNNPLYVFQRAVRVSDKRIFTRHREGKTIGWKNWEILATKSDLPQSGRTPLIDCRSNAITEFKVTFPKVFSKAPAIIVTPSSGTPGISGIPKYSAWDVTTTGFTIRIYNEDSEQRSPAFYWTAMAKS